MKTMSYPEKLRIGPFDVKVTPMSGDLANARNVFGMFGRDNNVISMDMSITDPNRAVEVFLHEITHAIWMIYGIEEGDKEERIVMAMGMAWTQIYRDNLELLKWLSKNLKEK